MPTEKKVQKVAELRENAARSRGIYLAEYKGLTVREISELRQKIRGAGAQMIVVKNRLMKLALRDTPAAGLESFLTGPNAAIFCYEDDIAPAKVIAEFAQNHEAIKWKGGYLEGAIFDAQAMARIAALPPKPQIVANAIGAIAGPLQAMVGVLQGLVSDLVYTLQAVADKRGGASTGS